MSGEQSAFMQDPSFLKKIIDIQSQITAVDFNLSKFMNLITTQMQSLTPATGAVVELVEEDEMVYRAASGSVKDYVGLRLKMNKSISGLCIQKNTLLYSEDTEIDARVDKEACRKVNARSLVVTPLIYQEKTVGVLKIISDKPSHFNEEHMQILNLMASFIASGLAHQLSYELNTKMLGEKTKSLTRLKQEHDELYYLAHFDILTGLANRKTFQETLKMLMFKTKQEGSLLSLLYLDIDHFKEVNDTFGHDTGDALLVAFGLRLKKNVRGKDLIARIGGDEFVIILQNIKDVANAIKIAEKILKLMQDDFRCNGHLLKVTTSIGLTFYNGENISETEFVKRADVALYEAKKKGRNNYFVYETLTNQEI